MIYILHMKCKNDVNQQNFDFEIAYIQIGRFHILCKYLNLYMGVTIG